MTYAKGTFEVQLNPQAPDAGYEDANIGRMTIDKQFQGDLEASSQGQMLSVMTAVEGSAGYVAIERVVGKLNGRTGSFVLQHSGTLNCGEGQLSVTVVPDSGTDELVGLVGTMNIENDDGNHFYTFDYSL